MTYKRNQETVNLLSIAPDYHALVQLRCALDAAILKSREVLFNTLALKGEPIDPKPSMAMHVLKTQIDKVDVTDTGYTQYDIESDYNDGDVQNYYLYCNHLLEVRKEIDKKITIFS